MIVRHFSQLVAIVAAIACCSQLAAALTPASDIAVPIIVIDAGRSIESIAVNHLVSALTSPVMRSGDLRREFALLDCPGDELVNLIKDTLAKAEESFFAGRNKEAELNLNKVITLADENRACYFRSPALREQIFKSYVYLAVIARGDSDEDKVMRYFEVAGREFPELNPQTTDFPPWVSERFVEVKKELAPPTGTLELDMTSNCELLLSGRNLGQGKRFDKVEGGEYAAKIRCAGHESPAFAVTVGTEPLVLRPITASYSDIVLREEEFVLKAHPDAQLMQLFEDAQRIAASRGWTKLIAVVGNANRGSEVWLIDRRLPSIVRRVALADFDAATMRRAGEQLTLPELEFAPSAAPTIQSWHKNGLAWMFFCTGLTAAGAGIGLSAASGISSPQGPIAWALIVGGGGLAATGTALFFVPILATERNSVTSPERTLGAVAGLRF